MKKKIEIVVSNDTLKQLENIAALKSIEVTEAAEVVLSLYAENYEKLLKGAARAAENAIKLD